MNGRSPLVSVVIPCFNLGAYLDEAVQSVLDQTFQDFEILIVDDGSDEPATRSLFTSYRRPRTRILRTDNRGLARARNLGLAEAVGQYVSFLDADDLFEPAFLERTVAVLETEPDVAFASCWLTAFGASSFDWAPETCSLPALLVEDTVCTAALTRRDVLEAVGGFDPEMPASGYEDWDLAITLAERGYEGRIVHERLFRYRIRVGSMTEVCTSAENHSRLFEYMVDKHASTYRRHYAAVLEDIRQRIVSFETVLEHPPDRPAIPSQDKWREGILALETHRRALQVLAYGGDRPDPEQLQVDLGTLGRNEPISRVWGIDRGTPIDRLYIERFLEAHRADIRGDVLEVKDAGYTKRYGHDLGKSTVLDVASQNADANLIADLSVPGALPRAAFDCVLLTQTMQFVYDVNEVVRNVHTALRAGGVALVTVPCVSRVDYEAGVDGDFWRFTPASARRLFGAHFGAEHAEVVSFGNVMSCVSFLHGLAVEDLPASGLDHHDGYFPLLVAVRAVKAHPRVHATESDTAPYEGFHDSATCRAVSGWVWDPGDPQRRLSVDVWVGDEKLGTVWADGLRPDLAAAGLSDGRFGFVLPAPRDLHDVVSRPVRVSVAGSDWDLENSPRALRCVCERAASPMPTSHAEADPWVDVHEVTSEIDDENLVGAHLDMPRAGSRLAFPWLEVAGWAVGRNAPVQGIEFTCAGRPFLRADVDLPRPDLSHVFPGVSWAGIAGFRANFSLFGLRGDVTLGVHALLADGSRAALGTVAVRVDGSRARGLPSVTAVIQASPVEKKGLRASVGHQYLVERALVVSHAGAGTLLGHPGLEPIPSSAAALEVTGDGLLWLHGGGDEVSPLFLERATGCLADDAEASFATDGDSSRVADALPEVLSGTALGQAVVFRASCVRSIGGFDARAESAAAAQWDLCIRLVEAGQPGRVFEMTDAFAVEPVPLRLSREEGVWLFERHEDLYRRHFVEALLSRESTIGEALRSSRVVECVLESELVPIVRANQRERDRLAAKMRSQRNGSGSASSKAEKKLGDFDRIVPFSPVWGAERGLCVDRYYIERFLERHADDVRGVVLDIHDSAYAARFGASRIERCDVLDVDPLNSNATVIADLRDAQSIPTDTYDCVILTQVLHFIDDTPAAVLETARILKPGGVVLLSLPCANRIDPEGGLDGDFWRVTSDGLEALLRMGFPDAAIDVQAWGNRIAVVGFLAGVAAEEIGFETLDKNDPAFPLVLTARVAGTVAEPLAR
jgi:GT2 family glycosyltransferase/SAM-dependent methyltransferase